MTKFYVVTEETFMYSLEEDVGDKDSTAAIWSDGRTIDLTNEELVEYERVCAEYRKWLKRISLERNKPNKQ